MSARAVGEGVLSDGRALLEAEQLVRAGAADRRAAFELRIERLAPHHGFALVAGVETLRQRLALPLLDTTRVRSVQHALGLSEETAERLASLDPRVDIDAVPEGSLAFPSEPIASIAGRAFEAVLASSLLVAYLRRGTGIATCAARLRIAAGPDAVVEASAAEEVDPTALLAIARAAWVGGLDGTTCPRASGDLGIPLRPAPSGTLDPIAPRPDESEDTWSSLPPGQWIELDRTDEEGDLVEQRRAGLEPSGWIATTLAGEKARFSLHLVAIEEDGAWVPFGPRTEAGRRSAVRYLDQSGTAVGDMIYLADERVLGAGALGAQSFTLLTRPLVRNGKALGAPENPSEGRARARAELASLPEGVRRLRGPDPYRVEPSPSLFEHTRASWPPPLRR